jgi:hypothetical protein
MQAIKVCKMYYTHSVYCTIDKRLLGFRGRCPFMVYIQSKPYKYGLKIVTLCDGNSCYIVNATPYTGRIEKSADRPVPSYCLRTLTEPIHGTKRNVTRDNWLTSVPLAESLLIDHELAIVCTLTKTKREMPQSFTSPRGKQAQSCISGAADLNPVHSKKEISVVVLSTKHKTATVDQDTVKPEIIQF